MAIQANNFSILAQEVWNERDINKKKELVNVMIDEFKFKAKQPHFRGIVTTTNSGYRLDKLASDIMLADTDKVIQI